MTSHQIVEPSLQRYSCSPRYGSGRRAGGDLAEDVEDVPDADVDGLRREDLLDRLDHRLGDRISAEPLDRRAHVRDPAIGGHRPEDVERVLGDEPVALLALAEGLLRAALIGDVLDDAPPEDAPPVIVRLEAIRKRASPPSTRNRPSHLSEARRSYASTFARMRPGNRPDGRSRRRPDRGPPRPGRRGMRPATGLMYTKSAPPSACPRVTHRPTGSRLTRDAYCASLWRSAASATRAAVTSRLVWTRPSAIRAAHLEPGLAGGARERSRLLEGHAGLGDRPVNSARRVTEGGRHRRVALQAIRSSGAPRTSGPR